MRHYCKQRLECVCDELNSEAEDVRCGKDTMKINKESHSYKSLQRWFFGRNLNQSVVLKK